MNAPKILVLGFYDRQNIGDDSYQLALTRLFPKHDLRFKSIDDVTENDIYDCDGCEKVDIIVVGGGDVINKYFMKTIGQVLCRFRGRIYGFSVGIPFPSEGVKLLGMFDHVYVRSQRDYEVASNAIGKANVTYLPDVSVVFSRTSLVIPCTKKPFSHHGKAAKKIGLCLAQPMFYNNPSGELLLHKIAKSMFQVAASDYVEFHLFSFNYSKKESESDLFVNEKLYKLLHHMRLVVTNHTEATSTTVQGMLKLIDKMDVIISSRYHSVMFSALQKKRVVPLYVSLKIDNLLEDMVYPKELCMKLSVDGNYQPMDIDDGLLTDCVLRGFKLNTESIRWPQMPNYKPIVYDMIQRQKTKCIKVRQEFILFEEVIHKCQQWLPNYLELGTDEDIRELLDDIHRKRGVLSLKEDVEPLDVARIISFIITGNIHSPYIWGLSENMQKEDFNLFEALDYIWKDWKKRVCGCEHKEIYYPAVKVKRNAFVNVDSILKSNYSEYHRSGWAYAVGGLMSLDGSSLQRKSNLLLDTYVDRSFHWGMATLVTLGILPYSIPWMGFIHHTFDTTHSEFNCVNLFKNQVFLKSLESCKGLIALTEYLASGLRRALDEVGFKDVPVHVIPHPMEFVPGSMFSMDKFLKNKDRKVTQIGAWLRNPFSIYELPLPIVNPLKLRKCVLRGKEMDQYFKPEGLYESLYDFLLLFGGCEERTSCEHVVSRDLTIMNKYCQGLFDHVKSCDESVTVIEKLSNDDYDKLLSENIVFLNLVDCSAVNTALECLVRNTPFIVNRHPAMEEIFGKKYPGFYDTMLDAANIMCDIRRIANISDYLSGLNKNKYELSYFVQRIADVASNPGGIQS